MLHAKISFRLEVSVFKENGICVAHCEALDVASQGQTEENAKENLLIALRLFINSCFERGTLNQVLADCGFVIDRSPDVDDSSVWGATQKETLDVPIPLVVAHAQAQAT